MYTYYNAHPKGLNVGDCVKRAITVAAQMDYMEVQRELNRYKKVTGAASFNSDYNPHKYVENVLKATKLSFPAVKGQPRMNAERFCKSYPRGRYILNMANHWSCCVDGVIYDTWDCSDKCVYTAYRLTTEPEKSNIKMTYVVQDITGTSSTKIKMYDNDGKLKSVVLERRDLNGYTKCLEEFGYINKKG